MPTNEALFAEEDERMARAARSQGAPLSNAELFAAEDARMAEPAMRSNIAAVAGSSADQFAAQRKAAQAAGMPKALGPAMPEDAQRWASVETVARDTRGAPTLAHRYTDEDFARLAHDDSGPLSQIERAVGQAVRYFMGAAPGGGLPGDVVAGARAIASAGPNFGAGAYGIAAVPFGAADQAIQALDDAAAWATGTPRRQLAPGMESFLLGLSRDASATAKATMGLPDDAGLLRRGVMSGLQSGAQSLALLPLGLARGSADLMLGAMGAVTGGLSYLKGREKGLAPLQAAAYGAEDAVAEVVTERYLGAAGLLKLIKAGSSAGKLFAYEVLKEVPGEIGATLWQNFNEWQNVNPDKAVSDFVAEQPEAVAETIIATLVGGGGQIGVVKGLERVLGVTERRQIEAVAAEQRAAAMGELAKLAEASKLRERSPEDFQAFAQEVTAGSVPALYFDARALLESGVDLDALARTMPSVAPQAEQALATGGDIIIPSGEFLTAAPGQAFLDSLVQNARTAPEAMSAAEAKDWMAERGDALKAQVDKAMAEREADAGFMAGMQAVQGKIAEQLDADPRFTKDVNQRFATLAASYYATTAERIGMTAEKLWEKYPLAVTSKAIAGETLAHSEPLLEGQRVPNTPGEIKAAKAAIARIEAAGGVTSPDDLRDVLRVSGYSQWAESPIALDVDATRRLWADIEAQFQVGQRPVLTQQGAISIKPVNAQDAEHVKEVVALADRYGGVPVIVRGHYGNTDARVHEAMRAAGFEPYRGLQEIAGRAMQWRAVGISWIRPGGGIGAVTPLFHGGNGLRRGSFDPSTNTIALLQDADLSTFLHESGHFFLTMHANIAAQIQAEKAAFGEVSAGEQQMLDDMNTLLAWFGVQPSEPDRTALDEWQAMTLDQQRAHHEQFARGFEAYLFTGKAPSIQLESLFQRFRSWLTSIYKAVKALGVELTPEVRGVMDRMLATDEQIRDAEAAQSMGMIFATPEEAAKFGVDWATYHAKGEQATQDAITALGARSLKDMQWLERAKGRELAKLQRQAAGLRREAKMDARAQVMSEPVYRAWAFLTGKGDAQDRAELPEQVKPEADSLFKAIALLGGLNRESATRDLGVHKDYYGASSGIFGKPVFRKTGGMSADAMAEALAEAGYLALDENGKHDLAELEEKIGEEFGGRLQYPIGHDYGEAPLPNLPEHATFGKLSTEALRERFGTGDDAIWRKLSALGMTSDTVGIDPDVVGEAFGFDSGNALVRAIAAAPAPAEAIEATTDRLMLERHGDITSPEALDRAANAAIHNEARSRFVAAELDALQSAMDAKRDAGKTRTGRTRRVAILPEAARRFAAETVARLKLRDLLPSRYEAAAARASRSADKALRADDIARATLEKRNQLINTHAATAAHEAQDEVKRALRYFKRLDSDASRKRLTADYAEQIDALLSQYDLRQRSLKAIDKQMAFAAWVQAQREQGIELDIDEKALSAKPYKEMTVEELRGLVDAVRQIEHLGRTKRRLLLAKGTREYEAVRDAMVAGIAANAHGRHATARSATTNSGRWWEKVKAFGAAHIKVAQWARIMDGGKDGGAVWEGLIRNANEQADYETAQRAVATERLTEIMRPVRGAGKMGGRGVFFPSIGRSMNRESVFVMALNMGNEGNIQRLLGGENWTVEQIQPVLATLTSADWRAAQQVWDFMESFRPQIGALERRVLGREPKWVEPRPLTVAGSDGEVVSLRGGYYPIVYDPKASIHAEENADAEAAKALLKGAHGAATTRRSFTKQRVESVTGRPLMYTLQGMYGGVNDVIHDLAWREWLIDSNRLLRSKKLDAVIRETYGPEVVHQFKAWREDIAIGDRSAQDAVDVGLNWLRQSVTVAGLGFNVMSAAMQPLGALQSISRIGPRWFGEGLKRYVSSPIAASRWVNEHSSFMENRARTRFRELNELRNQIQGGPAANLKESAGKYAYWLMMRAQQTVDVPTWLGAYEKATAQGNDEARAVQLADQAVIDSQGAGHMHSQSLIERGGAGLRLFTVFYSFMNTTLNMLVMKSMTNRSAAKTAVDFLLLVSLPAVLASLLRDALTPGDAGDDDEWELAKKLAGEQLMLMFGLFVLGREMAEAARTVTGLSDHPRDYSGPAGLRALTDFAALAKQIDQAETDDALRKAIVNVSGSWFGLPAAQINRTITGANALAEGETSNPAALLFGYQEPR